MIYKGAVHEALICVVFCLFGVSYGDRGQSPTGGGICWPARSEAGEKVAHDLVEMLVVAVCAVLVGADDFVEIEEWANKKVDWLRQYLALANGIPSHDTFGRVFAALDAEAFAATFRRWVSGLLPVLGKDEVVTIDAMATQPNIA